MEDKNNDPKIDGLNITHRKGKQLDSPIERVRRRVRKDKYILIEKEKTIESERERGRERGRER